MPQKATQLDRVKLEDLVLPDGQCLFNPRRPKARFATKKKAEIALEQAQRQRARTGSTHIEKRVYKCPTIPCSRCNRGEPKTEHTCPRTGCSGWHLTSREEFDQSTWQNVRRTREEQRR